MIINFFHNFFFFKLNTHKDPRIKRGFTERKGQGREENRKRNKKEDRESERYR